MKEEHDNTDKALITIIIVYNLILLIFSAIWLFTGSFEETKNGLSTVSYFKVNEHITYGLFLSGLLGGSFYSLRSVYQRLGEAYTPLDKDSLDIKPNRDFNVRVWFFWFLFRPLQGGILALILLSLVSSGLITIENLTSEDIENYYTMVAVGFLAGFGSHELMQKIQELIQVLFSKSNIKSSSSEEKTKENRGG